MRNELGRWATGVRRKVEGAIAKATDDAVLETDTDAWAKSLAEDYRFEPPAVDVEAAALHSNARVEVECTNAAGISYTTSELGNVIHEGYAFELRIPVSGDTHLLDTGMPGVEQLPAKISGTEIVCEWHWPDVKGTADFERQVANFKNELSRGVEALAGKADCDYP